MYSPLSGIVTHETMVESATVTSLETKLGMGSANSKDAMSVGSWSVKIPSFVDKKKDVESVEIDDIEALDEDTELFPDWSKPTVGKTPKTLRFSARRSSTIGEYMGGRENVEDSVGEKGQKINLSMKRGSI